MVYGDAKAGLFGFAVRGAEQALVEELEGALEVVVEGSDVHDEPFE